MGCTPSKNALEEDLATTVSLPMPVHDHNQAERKKERSSHGDGYNGYGFYKLRKNQDGPVEHSNSGMAANLSTWSKVNNLLVKYKPSFKSDHSNSKKSSSNDNLQEEEANKVSNRKSVDQALYFHVVSMKDVEQLAKKQAEPRMGIWERLIRGVKVADEDICLLEKTPSKKENSKWKCRAPPAGEDRVVLYFTSLRGIRKTFDDCCIVKLILWGFRVVVDERDISMHTLFRKELQDLLGKPIIVPKLFIAGKCIGGLQEILELHEAGELAKYLEGFPRHTCYTRPCHGCDDSRFVPCLNCDGSRKIFTQKLGGQSRSGISWMRCPHCNENGLIRCPMCCVDAAFVKT